MTVIFLFSVIALWILAGILTFLLLMACCYYCCWHVCCGRYVKRMWSVEVSGYLTIYPSLKSPLTITSHWGRNCDLGEGLVGSFPETSTDPENVPWGRGEGVGGREKRKMSLHKPCPNRFPLKISLNFHFQWQHQIRKSKVFSPPPPPRGAGGGG